MIYVFGSNWRGVWDKDNTMDTYNIPHSEVVIGRDIAEALLHHGKRACVVWFGPDVVLEEVPHVNIKDVEFKDADSLIVVQGVRGARVARGDLPNLHKAKKRILYTSSFYSDTDMEAWKWYDRIFVEGEKTIPNIQDYFDKNGGGPRTSWLQLGCSYNIGALGPNPYPEDVKNIFFAGRLVWEPTVDKIRRLIVQAPADTHFWIVTQALKVADVLYTVDLTLKGAEETILEPFRVPKSETAQKMRSVSAQRMREMLGEKIGVFRNFHPLETMPFGSFFNWQFHAFACLDFGYDEVAGVANNSKVFDPMRSGARILATRYSPTHYLINKYDAGCVVGQNDTDAMLQVLKNWRNEASELKILRAERFRDNESWRVRVPEMFEYVR